MKKQEDKYKHPYDHSGVKMPQEIEFAAEKLINDDQLMGSVMKFLQEIMQKLHKESMGASSFCVSLNTPSKITPFLLKIYGLTDKQMLSAFEKIGFKVNRMYTDLYYQTLSLLYYIGVKTQDDVLRYYCITLIYIKLFQGRKYKILPNGCQEEIAQHLVNNVLRKTHTFVKNPNPFIAIIRDLTPTLDTKYKKYVEIDPGHPTHGLISILKNGESRMGQIFTKSIRPHYYRIWNNGDVLINISMDNKLGGVEVHQVDVSAIESMLTSIHRDLGIREFKLDDHNKKYLKSAPYSVSNVFLDKVSEFINNETYEADIYNCHELFLRILGSDSKSKLASINIEAAVSTISSSKVEKGVDTKINKIKEHLDGMLKILFAKAMSSVSASQLIKMRKVLLLILVIRLKSGVSSDIKLVKLNKKIE
jgi:hypothetical protein